MIYRLSSGGRGGEGLGKDAAREMVRGEGFFLALLCSDKITQGKRRAWRVELSYLT
jgi:hypothetical protein